MSTLDLSGFAEPGLYLVMPDGETVALTREKIEARVRSILDNPEIIPPQKRAACDYQPCSICPERDRAEICHAIMTTLPFLDEIDRYMSYDQVTAVFRDGETKELHVRETTMQEALQYVTILSLLHYCEVGRKYYDYFEGVNPVMPQPQIADAVFLRMYYAFRGDMDRLEETLKTMHEELLAIAQCQAKRLRLISRRDAFLNAFVNTSLTTQLILDEIRKRAELGPPQSLA